ncbi:MAG: hypothetical protein HRT66_11340 [Flavobacteriaceae bacterium]|nr:hypothetical protein [Flavobacteriaceae bacterium]
MRYEIKIPKPCSENWNEMTPTQKGMYCSSCNKEVLDFTRKSESYLANILDKGGSVCGEFRKEQLNVDIISNTKNKGINSGIWFGVSAFIMSISSPVFSQNKNIEKTTEQSFGEYKGFSKLVMSDSVQIKGIVSDSYGALPGAYIQLEGYEYNTRANFDGEFSMTIHKKVLSNKPILSVSYIGHEIFKIVVDKEIGFLKIEMLENVDLMGEIVVIEKKNIFEKIACLFKRKKK